jgi:methylase of polypeptide subunit release factors
MTVQFSKRYESATEAKATGSTYTPSLLAEFVADHIAASTNVPKSRPLRVLDPAIGDGELMIALLDRIEGPVDVFGYETDQNALLSAAKRLQAAHPNASLHLHHGSFLDHAVNDFERGSLLSDDKRYDLIIANPPYVRTQIMGAERAQKLGAEFGLTGRVDLYHAFLLAMARVLHPDGTAGFIVSNRFMTTKGGASTRMAMMQEIKLTHVFDLGDTKLFDAAVLPAVLVGRGRNSKSVTPKFISAYETKATSQNHCENAIEALQREGYVGLSDGRTIHVQHGQLDTGGTDSGVWRLTSTSVEAWLSTTAKQTWKTFKDVGKIRVGVKTCADKVFIPKQWDCDLELHRPLTTHHIARRFRSDQPSRKILYPHESVDGRKRPVDLSMFPDSRAYLEENRTALEKRSYVIEAGREWYEIWVPQNPSDWQRPKLVFRDISEQPTFWMDLDGTIVNGDCYWMTGEEEDLWLALAVANSTFIEYFYDRKFNNKLYAGRRRFITQYVEHFPLPNPALPQITKIIDLCRDIYKNIDSSDVPEMEKELDKMVWDSFDLAAEKVSR